ncbi:MAG: LpqB family beta-propeller domain-containing protein [Acidimicrobiia bacterium]
MTFIGKDEHGGVPSQARPDLDPPPYWRLEMVTAAERPRHLDVSPDGTSVLLVLDRDSSDLWLISANGGPATRLTVDRALTAFWEDTAPVWSPDGTQVAYSAAGKIRIVSADGGPSRELCEGDNPVWVDDRHLLVTIERTRRSRLAVVSIDEAWPRPLDGADGDCGQVVVAPDRSWAVYTFFPAADRNRSDVRVVELATGDTRSLTGLSGIHDHSPAVSSDGQRIAFVSERSGRQELYLISPDGTGQTRLTSDQHDFSEPRWSPEGGRLAAVRTGAGRADLVTVEADTGDVTVVATGGCWAFPRWIAGGGLVATYEDYRTPPRLCRIDIDGTVEVLFDGAPAPLRTAPHVRYERIVYPSLDGLKIPAFLFKPPAAAGGKVPAVVYPHGGPTSHYGDEWDGIAQYFLDKGYAWLAINYRGSTSYGMDFERADHRVWGVADTDDCLAAADYLAGLDWIDPRRIAIFGASYGSYLALASLVRDQERFACGVAKYGDCDILTSWAQGDRGGREDMERMMGHPAQDPAGYQAGSPIHQVDAVAKALLIAHGELDERVSPAQSEQLVAELVRLNKTFEYVTYPTEGHGLLRTEPMLHFYRRLERFLDWYLI